MQFKNKVSMSLSDWRQFENDEDVSLAFGHVVFLSTKENSHKHTYKKEIIEEYAPSYLGKFIVTDIKNGDASSHTESQLIVGYIPSNQDVQYTYDSEGNFQAGVDVVISKIYAIDAYNIFKSKNTKSVSVEQLVGFTEETKDGIDGIDEKIVIGFEGIGITILGDNFRPSVPTANIKMIKMSAEDFEQEYQKHSIKISEVDKMDEILNKLTSIEEKLSKEEIMAKDKEEVVVEELAEDTVVEVEAEEVVEKEAEMEEAVEKEQEEKMADEPTEEPKEDEVEMGCGEGEKVEEKMAELESKLVDAENKIARYEAELSELKEFKIQIEAVKCQEVIDNTLSIAKKVIDESKYTELLTESKECVYATVEEWSTKVKASISEIAIAKMEEVKLSAREDNVMDMGVPMQVEKTKDSIYD